MPLRTAHAAWESPAEEELRDTLSFDEWLLDDPHSSVLITASSNAMAAAGIRQGDTLIVARGRTPQSGDIVLARLATEHVLRTYQPPLLVAGDHTYATIVLDETVAIVGVVTACIRKYH
jgi:SOS-response transcriptional repressor LexA